MSQRAPSTGRVWRAASWLIVAGLVVGGLWATNPPQPLGSATATTQFSAARAMEHVLAIADAPHPMGSDQIGSVRRYLVDELTSLGLEIDLQTVEAPDVFGNRGTIDVVNVVAWIPGTAHTKAVVLMAHYDTVPSTPGANDNTSAVAALLETARALQAGPALANDIVFLFTDGEEPSPRFGAPAFAAVPGLLDRVGIVVNFEANGSGGASLLVETSGPESWLVEQYASLAVRPAAFSFLPQTARLLGDIGTDFDVFRRAGLPGLHFAYLRGSPIYHTGADDIDSVNRGALQHHGSHALAIARHFGTLDLQKIPSPAGAVYFTLGRLVVRYPAGWSVPLALVAVAALVMAVAPWRPQPSVDLRMVVRSGVVHGAAIIGATLFGTVVWLGVAGVRRSLGVTESYVYGVLISVVAFLVVWRIATWLDRGDAVTSRYGCIAMWAGLAVLTAVTLPGFGYLFSWPALAAMAVAQWRPKTPGARLTRFSFVAVVTVLIITPAVDVFFMLAQPRPGNPDSDLTAAVFVPLLLVLLATMLLVRSRLHPCETQHNAAPGDPRAHHDRAPHAAVPPLASVSVSAGRLTFRSRVHERGSSPSPLG